MSRLLSLLIILMLALAVAETAEAQNPLDRARRAAERGAQRAIEREAERRADRAVTGAIECAVGDRACAEQAEAEGREVVYVDDAGDVVPAAPSPAQNQQPAASASGRQTVPGQGVWANYDFVPGDRPLLIEDFGADRVGNFPRRLQFAEGNMEIVEWEGQRALRATAMSAFSVPLPETLPERFTVEFDVYTGGYEWLALFTALDEIRGTTYSNFPGSFFVLEHSNAKLEGTGPRASTPVSLEGITPIRIAVDGSYIKAYFDEQRVINVPNAHIVRGNALHFITWYARPESPTYIMNLRVMAGGDDLYDRLMAEGRIATQGILFDTGSATIRPESTPTLKELARTLQQNGDLRLRIEGHTDSVGSADANLRLSQQRAQAVVDYLTQREGIAANRLEAAGLGQTQPAADNGTPEGRQTNRRVELVVLN
jgi:OmpA-OmpF porin, OOP family